jgi:Fe-S cluster biogenesis protein NfuA
MKNSARTAESSASVQGLPKFRHVSGAGFLAQPLLGRDSLSIPLAETTLPTRSAVESILDRIRPVLQADGGDVELVDMAGWLAQVRLTGACAGCPTSHMTVQMGIEAALRRLDPNLRVALVA